MSDWIPWIGMTNGNDVPYSTMMVDVKLRNGEEETSSADKFIWTIGEGPWDIVAWRPHEGEDRSLRVGDRVVTSGHCYGKIIAIYKNSAWVEFEKGTGDCMMGYPLKNLKRAEKPIKVGDKVHYLGVQSTVKAIDDKYAWVSNGVTYSTILLGALKHVER
mgnify:FL=1